MPKLSQIVAVDKSIKNTAERKVNEIYHALQAEVPLAGQTRTYQPRQDDGDQLPPESTKVQFTVDEKLRELREAVSKLLDSTATRDLGNQEAFADVRVADEVFFVGLPVPFLLFLEKYLTDLRTIFSKLPVLDPSVNWHEDEASGLYRSDPVVTTRTRKAPRAHVLYQATERHPAQVESFTVDEIVGEYTVTRFSGAITKARRDQLVRRADTLLRAVKFAREEANATVVEDRHFGDQLFDYLFA